ncbi:ABC transporter permease [Elusimicrobiota bacterium]
MRLFFILLKKEIKELLTPHIIVPMVATILILVFIGKIANKEQIKKQMNKDVAILDLDKSAMSKTLVNDLMKTDPNVKLLDVADKEKAILKAGSSKAVSLVVIPGNFGKNLKLMSAQKLDSYAFLRSLSLMGSVEAAKARGIIREINKQISERVIADKFKKKTSDFISEPVSSNDFVVFNDKQANVSIAEVVSFIQTQSTFVPIVLFMVIVIASQMVAIAVATEKENKTLETLLSLPVNRKMLVFAKLGGAAIVALLFAGVYMVGLQAYMGDVSGSFMPEGVKQDATAALTELGLFLDASGYMLVGISLFLGILCALVIAMILGLLAEDVKGVQAVTMPIMILVLIPYLLTMLFDINTMSTTLKYIVLTIPFSHPFLSVPWAIAGKNLYVIYGIIYQAVVFMGFVVLASKIFSSDAVFTMKLSFKKKQAS